MFSYKNYLKTLSVDDLSPTCTVWTLFCIDVWCAQLKGYHLCTYKFGRAQLEVIHVFTCTVIFTNKIEENCQGKCQTIGNPHLFQSEEKLFIILIMNLINNVSNKYSTASWADITYIILAIFQMIGIKVFFVTYLHFIKFCFIRLLLNWCSDLCHFLRFRGSWA